MKINFIATFAFVILLCITPSCAKKGCTDPKAKNYNEDAQKDDHSCIYRPDLGDPYGGGIVFYVDPGLEYFLVASKEDIPWQGAWGCMSWMITDAGHAGVGFGNWNSHYILIECGDWNAARLCQQYSPSGQPQGWHLPSKDEMALMYTERSAMGYGNFNSTLYWTSTQKNADEAFAFDCSTGGDLVLTKDVLLASRPVKRVEL